MLKSQVPSCKCATTFTMKDSRNPRVKNLFSPVGAQRIWPWNAAFEKRPFMALRAQRRKACVEAAGGRRGEEPDSGLPGREVAGAWVLTVADHEVPGSGGRRASHRDCDSGAHP